MSGRRQGMVDWVVMQEDPTRVPDLVQRPLDDGAADHLLVLRMPPMALPSMRGEAISVDRVPAGLERLVIYGYR